jgi:shikimate kinase
MGIHSMPRITLIGYRGTGKTTVAERLARRLSCSWSDADAVLEEKIGCSIAALVRDRGEPAFRDEESLVLEQLLSGFPGVLATGGGVVLRPANRAALRGRGRPVVWLTASADVVRGRLALDPTTASRRPGLAGGDPLDEVATALVEREPLYRECADLVVDAAAQPPDAIADRIVHWLATEWPAASAAGERRGS